MIAASTTLSTAGLDRFLLRLPYELAVGVDIATNRLKPIAEDNIEETDAVDTYSLKESLYASTVVHSGYAEAVARATEAYANNPTKWPAIRYARRSSLQIDPEAKPKHRHEGYLAVAAAHGKANEEGFLSVYGNWIPPRPFMQMTAQDGFPMVVDEIRRALLRALK